MDAILKYLDMGGYAAWVWPAYGLAAVALGGILFFTLRDLKTREREFEALRSARRGGESSL